MSGPRTVAHGFAHRRWHGLPDVLPVLESARHRPITACTAVKTHARLAGTASR